MDLIDLGWKDELAEYFFKYQQQGYEAGRISAVFGQLYQIFTKEGEILGELSGKMRYEITNQIEYPAVGDWVVLSLRPGEGRGSIHGILPRRSKLSRKVAGKLTEEQVFATNIDYIFLVNALNQDFNLRKIERFLIMAWDSGANPVIILSKADLCVDVEEKVKQVETVALGVPVHVISIVENQGIDDLKKYLKRGSTTVMLGASGVGKSTLINYFSGENLMETQSIREGDDKGRHTTTHRQLVALPEGGLIIDTPGIREMQLWNANEGIYDAFEDIEALRRECFFKDCNHGKEPGCAVKKALREGTLDGTRLKNYIKLQRELKFIQKKQAQIERLKEKRNQRRR